MSVKQDKISGTFYYCFNRNFKQYWKGGFRIKDQAKDAEIIAKDTVIKQEIHPEIKQLSMTLKEACDWFFEAVSKFNADGKNDKLRLSRIVAHLGHKTVSSITPDDVLSLRAYLAELGLTPNNVNYYHGLLRQIFNTLTKHRKFNGSNPTIPVRFTVIPAPRPKFIPEEHIPLLEEEARKNTDFYPYFFVGLYTGLRCGELVNMRVRDHQFSASQVFLPKTKNGKSRFVHLAKAVNDFLSHISVGKRPDDQLLGEKSRFFVSGAFRKTVKNAGLFDITFHSLRHTFVSRLLSNGVPIYLVSKMVGHSSVTVTEMIYGHIASKDLKGTAEIIDKLFFKVS